MHEEATDQCIAACLAVLRQVAEGLTLAVDEGDEVLAECVSALRAAKTSGFAKKLVTRVWQSRWDANVCKRVPITACDDPPPSYDEIPPGLHDFDADDQKFLAVALSEGNKPLVFQALDGEWWERRTDLHDAGLNVQFLCPADLFAMGA